jgi:hypothetical protein
VQLKSHSYIEEIGPDDQNRIFAERNFAANQMRMYHLFHTGRFSDKREAFSSKPDITLVKAAETIIYSINIGSAAQRFGDGDLRSHMNKEDYFELIEQRISELPEIVLGHTGWEDPRDRKRNPETHLDAFISRIDGFIDELLPVGTFGTYGGLVRDRVRQSIMDKVWYELSWRSPQQIAAMILDPRIRKDRMLAGSDYSLGRMTDSGYGNVDNIVTALNIVEKLMHENHGAFTGDDRDNIFRRLTLFNYHSLMQKLGRDDQFDPFSIANVMPEKYYQMRFGKSRESFIEGMQEGYAKSYRDRRQ